MSTLAKIAASLGLFVSGLFGHHAPAQPIVGATVPIVTDFYNDSLQTGINATATSFTLVRGTDSEGLALNGAYGFTIDQGSPSQENVFCATVSGVNVSNCVRGLDLTTGTTSVVALEQVHNRGATVQITTAPIINILANIMRGVESIPQSIFYDPSVTVASLNAGSTQALASVAFADSVGSTGCANASLTTRGCVQLATTVQIASSTSLGSTGAALDIPASAATSSPGANYTLGVVATQNDGKISPLFLNGASDNYIFNGTTTMATSTTASSTVTQSFASQGTTTIAATASHQLSLNGVNYTAPSTQGALNSSLLNNGSGVLSWSNPNAAQYSLASTTASTGGSGATLTSASMTVPAGVFTASSTITYMGQVTVQSTGNTAQGILTLQDAASDVFATVTINPSNTTTCSLNFLAKIIPVTISSQQEVVTGTQYCGTTFSNILVVNTTTVNFANAISFNLKWHEDGGGANNVLTTNGFDIVANP